MITYLEGKQPVSIWWDERGRFEHAAAVPFPANVVSRATFADQPGINQSLVAAHGNSIDEARLVLLTTGGRKRPDFGYIVPALTTSQFCPCIKVSLVENNDGLTSVHLHSGLLNLSAIDRLSLAVGVKQTKRQRWLADVWNTVAPVRHVADMSSGKGYEFCETVNLGADAVDSSLLRRLAIMLLWQYWERTGATDEVKSADLRAMGLHGETPRGALWTTIRRMELQKTSFAPLQRSSE
jgi:hypothetical protein